jgi:hypothetical protein
VEDAVAVLAASKEVLSLCQALVQAACPRAMLVGDLAAAERFVAMLAECSARHGFAFSQTYARSFCGLLTVRGGDPTTGLHAPEAALGALRGIEFGVQYTAFLAGYAEGLGTADDAARGLAMIEQALARAKQNNECWCMTELLRIQGELEARRGGGRRGLLRAGAGLGAAPAGRVVGVAVSDEPRAAVACAGAERSSRHTAGQRLRPIHRGFRRVVLVR